LYSQLRDPKTAVDVWVHARRGDQADEAPLLTRAANQEQAQFSPDGRWVAYVSNESGPNEVFVAETRVDPPTRRLTIGEGAPVSKGGGFAESRRLGHGDCYEGWACVFTTRDHTFVRGARRAS
jgi:hypothetical protein